MADQSRLHVYLLAELVRYLRLTAALITASRRSCYKLAGSSSLVANDRLQPCLAVLLATGPWLLCVCVGINLEELLASTISGF